MRTRPTTEAVKQALFAVMAFLLVLFCGLATAAQDRYTLSIPDGLAFADFRGYENWENVAVSQTETAIKVILANPIMMAAFRSGLPAEGKFFPDGSKVVKIFWFFKKNEVSPYSVNVPDTLKELAFIEKDTKRFPNTHGWAYADWAYDAGTDTFKPSPAFSERRKVWLHMPHEGFGAGLYIHRLSEKVNVPLSSKLPISSRDSSTKACDVPSVFDVCIANRAANMNAYGRRSREIFFCTA